MVDKIEVANLPVSLFDLHIEQLRYCIESLNNGERKMTQYDVRSTPQEILNGLPIQVAEDHRSRLILRKNTFLELGNPEAGSCAFPIWSNEPSLVSDGRITLIGPDIPETPDASLPFGQVILLYGEQLSKAQQMALEQKQYDAGLIDGYMIRSAPGRVWGRVSREVVSKGLNFEMLGKVLIALFKQQIPQVESVELLFVTSSKADVEQLAKIAGGVKRIGDGLVKETWAEKGFDLDACIDHDCSTCHEVEDCDDIRDVVQLAQQTKRKRKAGQRKTR